MSERPMDPEAEEAIRIADKHLAGQPPEKRVALAKDILLAISQFAGIIARDCLHEAFEKVKRE